MRFLYRTKEKKQNSSQTHSSVFQNLENIPLEIAVYDLAGNIIYLNPHFNTNGLDRNIFIGRDDLFYFHQTAFRPADPQKRKDSFQKAVESGRIVRFTETIKTSEGKKTLYFKRSFQSVYPYADNEKYIAFFGSNITAVILSQKELKYIAFHDKLTNLGNRDAFNRQLDQLLLEAHRPEDRQPAAILFCDLDNFKLVNDSLGHDSGDLLLVEAAQRMRSVLRRSDYIFRLGGDEFVILLKNLKEEVFASRVAEKLLNTLSEPYFIDNHHVNYITLSIGIAVYPGDGMEREDLLNKADMAMYEAKKGSKNNFKFFSEAMTVKAKKRLTIVKNLRELIQKKDYEKQFYLLYQPIVEQSPDGNFRVIASEALLRWNHPRMGAVSPGLFIPIAEESNLINHFGEWILQHCFADFKHLEQKYPQQLAYISVNLSAKQINSPQLVETLQKAINSSGVRPQKIQIEITETSFLDESGLAFKNIQKLKSQGYRFAIDDFGVGYASLSYLQKIPANVIKIDQSFTQQALTSNRNSELVKAIIALGINLNKEVIAEGVEEQAHLDFLNSNACYKYQGFLFSRPLSLADFEKLLKKNK